MNIGQLKSQLQVLVPDFPHSSYATQILQWLNLAQSEIAITGEKSDLSELTSEYSFTRLIEPKRNGVSYDNTTIIPVTLVELDRIYASWRTLSAGTPKYYLLERSNIIFVPEPDTADKTILVNGWYLGDTLTGDSDEPFEVDGIRATGTEDLESLLLEYCIGMMKFSLGFYKNRQEALSNFFAILATKENDFIKLKSLLKRRDLERDSFQKDTFHLSKIRDRLNYG